MSDQEHQGSENLGKLTSQSVRQIRLPSGFLRANTLYLFILTLVAVGGVLRLMGGIFIPFVIALLLSFVLAPIAQGLVKLRIPRILAVSITLLIFLAFGYLVVLVVYSSVQSLLREFPKYQLRFTILLRELIDNYGLPADFTSQLEITRTIGNALISFSGNFMSFASGFMVVFVFLLFLMMEQPYLRGKMSAAFRDSTTRRFALILAHINQQVARYIAVKIVVSMLTAIIVYFTFSWIGVDFPFIWAIMTFLFNFIPSIGSIVITAAIGVFAIVQFFPEWNPVIATFVAMGVTQFAIGNVLDPKLLGDRLNLSPVVILLSLLIWGWIWGTAGLFLAVPLTVTIKIILENVPGMEAFGILMGTGNFRSRTSYAHGRPSSAEEHAEGGVVAPTTTVQPEKE